MASPVERRATYEDLVRVPAHQVAEIVGGDMHVSPRPASRQALAASGLDRALGPPFHDGHGGPGGWWILFEPELHLGDDVLVPDLAAWRRERMPEFPDTAAFTLPPDWVCEVVSTGTERLDRAKKMPAYAREGVAHLWLLNPAGAHARGLPPGRDSLAAARDPRGDGGRAGRAVRRRRAAAGTALGRDGSPVGS